MLFIPKFLSICIYSIGILLLSKVSADKNEVTIKILTERPDKINEYYYKELYNYISNTISEKLNYKVIFDYDKEIPYPRINLNDMKTYSIKYAKEFVASNYDMFILNGDFLFSDASKVEDVNIKEELDILHMYEEYMDLTNYVNEDVSTLHKPLLYYKGYYDDNLYALPFELDFDVLYYYNNKNTTKSLSDINMANINWEELLKDSYRTIENDSISIGLNENEELLNFFVEYIFTKMDISLPENFDKLCSIESSGIMNNFKEFIFATKSKELNVNDAYDCFIEGKRSFFKGKASHYHYLKERNSNIRVTTLPGLYSILNSKYLVVNKNSLIDKNILAEVAIKLTSREIQLLKAEKYGRLPTFSLSANKNKQKRDNTPEIFSTNSAVGMNKNINKNINPNVNAASANNTDNIINNDNRINPDIVVDENNNTNVIVTELTNLFEELKVIDIKALFKDEQSATFMEIQQFLPKTIKCILNSSSNLDEFFSVLENTKKVLLEKKNYVNVSFLVFYIPMVIFILFALTMMGLVIKYRNHPHLKIFSPDYCILIIIGIVFRIIHLAYKMQIRNVSLCKYNYVYETLYTDLCLFPMVAVTYRIYRIFNYSSKLNISRNINKKIFISFVIGMLVMLTFSSVSSFFFNEYYIGSNREINTFRQPDCYYLHSTYLEFIERRINEIIYVIMVYMVIKTGSVSKQFGEFKFVYIMLFTGLMEYLRDYLSNMITIKDYYGFSILIIFISMVIDTLLIYYLVGSRIIYAIKHPEELKKDFIDYSSYYKSYLTTRNMTKFTSENKNISIDSPYVRSIKQSTVTTISELDFSYDQSNDIFNKRLNSFTQSTKTNNTSTINNTNEYQSNINNDQDSLPSNSFPNNSYPGNSCTLLLSHSSPSDEPTLYIGREFTSKNNIINILRSNSAGPSYNCQYSSSDDYSTSITMKSSIHQNQKY